MIQEIAKLQKDQEAAQKEMKKSQLMLRQLERQFAKAHLTRKESVSALQQLQVWHSATMSSFLRTCQSLVHMSVHVGNLLQYLTAPFLIAGMAG